MVGVRGRVVDERGSPLPGLLVSLETEHPFDDARATAADGTFEVAREASGAALRVTDRLGLRVLARLERFDGGDVRVPAAEARGWAATLGQGAPFRLSRGNALEVLVDESMFHEMARAVARAERSVWLTQLLFFTDFSLHPVGTPDRTPLVREFVDAARRGAAVRVLLNENAVVPDSYDEVRTLFLKEEVDAEVRRFPVAPAVMHAKVLVVDGEEAFVIGPPFQQRFLDSSLHLARSSRRGDEMPHHDLTVRLRGPVVADVASDFAMLWNARVREEGGEPVAPPASVPPPQGPHTVQLLRTLPADTVAERPQGERGIREAYLRALAEARDLVYVETQYFTSRTMTAAIDRALRATPTLEVILVLNEWVDIPGYLTWQKRRLAELGHPGRARLGVFRLASPQGGGDERQVYVHAKVALVDDAWATLGTANLDSASVEDVDEFGIPFDSNVETNVVVLDGVEGEPRTGFVERLRRRLWAEHLADEGVWTAQRPEEGWLALWRRVAERNAERLARGERMGPAHVLPYVPGEE